MTGKEWTIIRGYKNAGEFAAVSAGIQGAGIIGIASKSDEEPLRTDFKGTALENMGPSGVGGTTGSIPMTSPFIGAGGTTPPTAAGKMTKYSEWEFKAESPQKNDHSKIYRAYHEGW